MVNITNKEGISEGLFLALSLDEYSKEGADFSATELIAPSRIVALTRRHSKELNEDASDIIYRVLGRSVHSFVDNARKNIVGDNSELRNKYIMETLDRYTAGKIDTKDLPAALAQASKDADNERTYQLTKIRFENRIFVTLEINGIPIVISGQIDYWRETTGKIRDYKITSRWVSTDGVKNEWEKQMNIYAFLLRESGHDPKSATIEAIYRDWSKTMAARDSSYPQKQIEQFDVQLWEPNRAKEYVIERIKSHLRALSCDKEEEIVGCSKEERWERNEEFAVTKPGRSRALRVLDSREEAETWISEHKRAGESMSIEHRQGTSTRCISYCPVSQFCSYYKYFVKE